MNEQPPPNRPAESEPGYLRIGELARRTGASPELLRAWERRYGLLRPARSQGGFRLYTATDEARIHRMREHLARGLSAAEAARLAVDAETQPTATQTPSGDVETRGPSAQATARAAPTPDTTTAAPHPLLQEHARDLVAALDRFDEEQAHALLDRLLATYRIETILRDLLIPYLHDLGERWARGDVSVAQEHFASNLLRGRLLGLARGWGQGHGPAVILACPPGEQHDLGLLAFGITLRRRGWRIIYLGPDTPIATIRQVTVGAAPQLVVLAGALPGPLATHTDAIADLARQTPVALGGAGATAELAGRIGARLLDQDPVSAAERLDQALSRTPDT
ncbi:MAG TPA: B12-binding domain-containing protein [Actinomycetes bacterium]|jgi:DNA-binding transcriptional MerR regulator|nr:B12-binding domain-containing protein [Actinomycetes bacterium]